jgi:hypothetical protein
VALLMGLLVTIAAPSVGVNGPVQVLGGPDDQRNPSVNATYLVWTRSPEQHPSVDHAYAKELDGDGSRFRLDPDGTQGVAGGIDPSSDRAIYQQMTSNTSDLYWFDLVAKERSKILAVSNDKWEREPRVSDAFIFFARDSGATTSLFLFDRTTRDLTKIESYDFTTFFVMPGAVGDRYATWTVCGPTNCNAFVHDSNDGSRRKLPAPEGKAQYAPVIDEGGGFVYFARSGPTCGASVTILRRAWPIDPDGVARKLLELPSGIDVGWAMSLDHDAVAARLDLWFSRYRCAGEQGDIYELRDVETVP